ncbi:MULTISPECIES: VirD4-like conjugal transfer protein, CD1115 family [unclassified Breznakia]|uniref:VirD4-like conjugal transfer protein, CD1115 family n=1 Tax=unclassified Breznakia TaxID=2623764 RepID=UPI002474CE64|nr:MULTISPECIES: type IV secretory system conjugative DNA transfer family protein [unclassified Breznakia]MDH6367399.1 type IV secretory pathway TraG/TraD family ATPase VirD4 [Breznakia sp. PH1-1]MDH6403931.1 type IV secretory pathway TraG/TraD family ATPase VirD4 [Breznakia sp. PF1-11]MDH6411640.1 type IV secretory pathway TraG/TraD family ATPase VirD4 [Breznakia sp. PFB1-11]MDH6414566.1 type IV secretory pathway TraG/TraD family ATPase VirD4 [Breznakia sp. PFB1-14]MDH6418672.1 type IV secret
MSDKRDNRYKSHGLRVDVIVLLISVPILIILLAFGFWAIDTELGEYYSFFLVFSKHVEIIPLALCVGVLIFLQLGKMLNFKRPKKDDDLASARWATVKEQKEFFGTASIDPNETIEVAGMPINKLDDNTLLFEKEDVHSLTIGTTRSGKFRKLFFQFFFLIMKALESGIAHDPKKELYQHFHVLLENAGYKVYCLDFRNLQYSNCWNPLNNIIRAVEEGDIDNADQYAQDIVTALVVDNGQGEKIWIDGQKALIKGIILAVCSANIPVEKKNFFSVYQTLALLGGEITVAGKSTGGKAVSKAQINLYMESLSETDVARIAYTAVATAPEKTKGSFMTSALSTLSLFSSRKLAKVLSRSDFKFEDFADGKTFLFVVNPDEKSTYNSITAMVFDQAYQELVFKANQLSGRKLKKRVHMLLDEFGNLPAINKLASKVTVALSRAIIYHFAVQDNGQMNEVYGDDTAKIIRGNCNLRIFISSGDLETCREMSAQIGEETIWVDSVSGNYSEVGRGSGGNVSYQKQRRALVDANELASADKRDGKDIVIYRTYSQPLKVNLPDCSDYKWYDLVMKNKDENEVERDDQSLNWAVPRFVEWKDDEKKEQVVMPARPSRMGSISAAGNLPNEADLLWYWSTRDDLQESVLHNIKAKYEDVKRTGQTFNAQEYLLSDEFRNWLDSVDIEETKLNETSNNENEEILNTLYRENKDNSASELDKMF